MLLYAARVPAKQADLVLGWDLMVAAAEDALASMDSLRTHAAMNTDVAPTGTFTQNPDWEISPPATLEHLLRDRTQRLTDYQNRAYAAFVRDIAVQETARTGTDRLAREVAISLFKLMAYKDEYEVARLYAESGFFDRVGQQFEGDYKLRFHLAPPLLAKRDSHGHLIKQSFAPGSPPPSSGLNCWRR